MTWKLIIVLLNMGTFSELASNREMCRDQLLQYRIIYYSQLWSGVCLDPDGEEESFETAGRSTP